MSNKNIQNLKIVKNPNFYVNPAFYTEDKNEDFPLTPEKIEKFMENIDMKALDKIIEEIERTEEIPEAWIPFEEAMDDIRREMLNE